MLFVQGASLLSQFVLARFLSPDSFAVVKIVENLIRLLLIPAMAGIPTAVTKFVAESKNETEQCKILGQGLCLVTVISLALSLLIYIIAPMILRESLVIRYASGLIWTVCFTAVVRTVIAFYLGRKEIRRVAAYNAIIISVSLSLTIAGGIFLDLGGWVVGRFAGELLVFIGVLWLVRGYFTFAFDKQKLVPLVVFGVLAFVSLLLDRIVTMSDVILLARSGISTMQVGVYGLGVLLIAALGLPNAAIMAASFPIIAEQPSVQASWQITRKLLWRMGILTLGICILGYWGIPIAIRLLWGELYAAASVSFRLLLGWFCLNSILTVIGTFFYGIGKPKYSVVGNLVGMGVYFGLYSSLIGKWGINGIVYTLSICSLVRLSVFLVLSWWLVKNSSILSTASSKK